MKNTVCARDFFFMLIIMHISTIQISGNTGGLRQDNWIPLLLSILPATLLVLLYARMTSLMPGKSLYDMALYVFGKGGKVISFFMALYALHVSSLILCNTTGFAQIALHKTPQVIIMTVILAAALYIAKSGTRAIGLWSFILFVLAILITVLNTVFSIPIMEAGNLMPVLEYPWELYAKKALLYLPYPFGEVVFLMAIVGDVPREGKGRPYRAFVGGTAIANIFLVVAAVRTIAVLGPCFAENTLMASYKAVGVAKVGSFLQRIESITGTLLMLFGTAKIAICTTAASRGLDKALSPDGVDFTVPCGLISLALAPILFQNSIQLYKYVEIYLYYAPVFQILIPLAIWIGAEVKNVRAKRLTPLPLESGGIA